MQGGESGGLRLMPKRFRMCRTGVDERTKASMIWRALGESGQRWSLRGSRGVLCLPRTYRCHPSCIPPIDSSSYKNSTEVMARLERPRLGSPHSPFPPHPSNLALSFCSPPSTSTPSPSLFLCLPYFSLPRGRINPKTTNRPHNVR